MPTSQKGGTLIAEDVLDRETHDARLADPDGYRPGACGYCRHERLHVHDYRERTVRDAWGIPKVRVIRHQCARCQAKWRTLPGFLCVGLPRCWPVVEAALSAAPRRGPKIPPRTRRRWWRRLQAAARVAVAALASSGDASLSGIAARVGLEARRSELVAAFDGFWAIAATLWRLLPGLRLM